MDEREKQQPASPKFDEEAKRTSDAKVAKKIEDLDVAAERAANVSGGRKTPPPEPD
jgi:hypothetical protein